MKVSVSRRFGRRAAIISIAAIVGTFVASVPLWVGVIVITGLVTANFYWLGAETVVSLLGVLTGAIPKAGVKFGEIPLPVMLLGLVAALTLILRLERRQSKSRLARARATRVWAALAVLYAWTLVRSAVLILNGGSGLDVALLASWFLVPATILAAGVWQGGDKAARRRRRWARSLEIGVVLASLYSLVQLVFGVAKTAIPGITIALFDSYDAKPLLINGNAADPLYKIPSTYQNGNVLGVVAGFFLVLSVVGAVSGVHDRWAGTVVVTTAVATFLTGSRTAVWAVLVGMTMVWALHGRIWVKVLTSVGVIAAYATVLLLQPGLVDRLSPASLTEATGAGRVSTWSEVVSGFSATDWLFGGGSPVREGAFGGTLVEGALGAVQQVGLVGLLALLALVAICLAASGEWLPWVPPLTVIGTAFVLDSSYLVFPTLYVLAARMWAPPVLFTASCRSLRNRCTKT